MQQERVLWDPEKAETNWRKHRIQFDEAQTVFHDPRLLSMFDDAHSSSEDRFVAIGASLARNLLVVVYTVRGDEAWIISARPAMRGERRVYMEGDQVRDGAATTDEVAEYDFSKAVRGRHYIKPRGPMTVEIDPIVAEFYRGADSVNEALRMLIVEGRAPKRR